MPFRAIRLEVTKHQLLKERLLAYDPALDEETLRDSLEGITDLHEMIAAVIRSALVDEALQGGLRSRIEDMKIRLSRLEERGTKALDDGACDLSLDHHGVQHAATVVDCGKALTRAWCATFFPEVRR